MRVYFDSSAFAKRYIDEAGTAEVLAWCERASELAISVIAVPELISAFCRPQR
jgi:predicted nucleic acid-binding protein